MAVYESEVEWIADGSSPRVIIPPVAEDSDVEGMKYVDPDSGEIKGGFEGYCDGELTRVRAEIAAGATGGTVRVFLHTSPEKLVKWHNDGWTNKKGEKKKFKAEKLDSEKAKKEKDKLVNFKGN